MKRHGTYTKRPNGLQRIFGSFHARWRWFKGLSRSKKLMIILVPILAFLIIVPLVTYALFARDIDNPERLMNRNNTGVELLDINGEVFYSTGTSKPLNRLPLSEISDNMEKALISSEDKNFYEHSGVSITGLLAAVYANVLNQDLTAYGGSTITQQLVKNTLLSSDKTFFRKYQELAIAVAVERRYSKDEILDMYLNSVYYGENAFGIDEAAKTYFNKSANDLTLAESSMLVGLLPAPSAYSPISGDLVKAKKQQARVLGRMVEDKNISTAQKDEAIATELTFAGLSESNVSSAPHFAEMVVAELNERYGEETVTRSGYRVKTTLDLNWQKQANKIVSDQTEINAALGGRNAAMVAIDPRNGEIRALVGSADYDNPEFGKVNMAITARQPGSSFKPIYYTEAMAERIVTPGTIMEDKAKTYGEYEPQNFDFKFRGKISIRNALSQSLNIPAVDVMQKLGVDEAVATARRMGISTVTKDTDYGLSLALGAAEAKPLEMTNAYAAFANGGEQFEAVKIKTINNKFGNTIYTYRPTSKRVQTAQASFLISDILSDNNARAPTFGSSLNIPGRDVAVKTGSTDDNRDAWTIGYTPSLAIGVWVGNNENEVMQSGGSAFAGPIWRKSMQAFLGESADEGFKAPSGVSQVSICTSNGLRATGGGTAGTYKEYFISGTVPTESCNAPRERETPVVKDADGDGVNDSNDKCANTPAGTKVDREGCPEKKEEVILDTDGDGVIDTKDKCAATPVGASVDQDGCPVEDEEEEITLDTDGDGVTDDKDKCAGTMLGVEVDATGCPVGGRGAGDPKPPEEPIIPQPQATSTRPSRIYA